MPSRSLLPLSSPSSRLISRPSIPSLLNHPLHNISIQIRHASNKSSKKRKTYLTPDLARMSRYSLCDAMRYIRAFEVGYPPSSPKYEAHIRLRTMRDGPVIRNRIQLPHPVRSDLRVAVLVDPESPAAAEARAAGASLVGNVEEVLGSLIASSAAQTQTGKAKKKPKELDAEPESPAAAAAAAEAQKVKIDFDRLVCHPNLLPALTKVPGIARVLGPKGLMPSVKTGTVTPNIVQFVREATSSVEYRERMGIIRLSVGQLGFSAEQVRDNLQSVVDHVKKDAVDLLDRAVTAAGGGGGIGGGKKEVEEVVLSSTHGPGFSLSGEFTSVGGVGPEELRREV